MRRIRTLCWTLSCLSCLLACAGPAFAAGGINTAIPQIHATRNVSLCNVTSPGKDDTLQQALTDFRQAALAWHVDIQPLHYQDSAQAADDFRQGVCDLVNLPGAQAGEFNRFSATLEAVGAAPDYEHLQTALRALALEKAAPLLRNGEFEVVSIWPAGAEYLQVSEPTLADPALLANRTLAVATSPEALTALAALTGMVAINGATPPTALQHGVDVSAVTATRDPARSGQLLTLPLRQRTWQLIARHSALPADFGQQARRHAAHTFERRLQPLQQREQQWPATTWIALDDPQRSAWNGLYQQIRVQLRNDAVYDASALTLLRKVRCALDSSALECGGGSLQVE